MTIDAIDSLCNGQSCSFYLTETVSIRDGLFDIRGDSWVFFSFLHIKQVSGFLNNQKQQPLMKNLYLYCLLCSS